ncbi:hypothetical protein CFP56_031044 [Quercus suber]|uniref:Uncharacterized protein n=1 Tax=Quercus suber TaxID=58331 RepID=A0AAW0LUI6_QUESU
MVTHESSALPPQPPPKETLLGVTTYLFVWTNKKDEHIDEEGVTPVSISVTKTAPIAEKTLHSPSVTNTVKLREPIPED